MLKKTDCLAYKKPEGAVDLYVLESSPQSAPATAPWGMVWPVPQQSDWQNVPGKKIAIDARDFEIAVYPGSYTPQFHHNSFPGILFDTLLLVNQGVPL